VSYLSLKHVAKCYSGAAKCYAQSIGTKSSIAFFPTKTQKKSFLNWHRKCIYIWYKKERELIRWIRWFFTFPIVAMLKVIWIMRFAHSVENTA
jgi:hypothetical protein